jgi:hypothetical protein
MNFEAVVMLQETIYRLDEFFKDHPHKTAKWLTTKNPLLGNVEPINFFLIGRGHRVLYFVICSLDSNFIPQQMKRK